MSFLNAKTVHDSLLFNSKNKSQHQTSLFLFTAGYRTPVNKNIIINSGHGVYLEAGINIGRLISKEHVVGIYAGYAWMDRFWSTSFNTNFLNDYNKSINTEQSFSQLDSSVINVSSSIFKKAKGNDIALPGCTMNSFHNYSLYYGVMIKLPIKYLPIVKVYTGTTRSHLQGDGNIASKEKDYNIFQLRRPMYGCELIILKGLQKFIKNKSKAASLHNNLGLSIYYEYCNFSNASLYFYDGSNRTNIPIKRFVNSGFLTKYKNEMAWGFRLSFYII